MTKQRQVQIQELAAVKTPAEFQVWRQKHENILVPFNNVFNKLNQLEGNPISTWPPGMAEAVQRLAARDLFPALDAVGNKLAVFQKLNKMRTAMDGSFEDWSKKFTGPIEQLYVGLMRRERAQVEKKLKRLGKKGKTLDESVLEHLDDPIEKWLAHDILVAMPPDALEAAATLQRLNHRDEAHEVDDTLHATDKEAKVPPHMQLAHH